MAGPVGRACICASCKLALEGVVRLLNSGTRVNCAAFDLRTGGRRGGISTQIVGATAPVSTTLPPGGWPCPLGARTLPVSLSYLAESSLNRVSAEEPSRLCLCSLVRTLWKDHSLQGILDVWLCPYSVISFI